MSENKIEKVSNPLTIIAVFSGLSEVAGTVVIPLLAKEQQSIYIWFIIIFPLLLIILFFVTLNFNPKVLYAPSDYTDEKHFVDLIQGPLAINEQFDKTLEKLEKIKGEVSSRYDGEIDENIDELEKTIKNLRLDTLKISIPSNVSKEDIEKYALNPKQNTYFLNSSLSKLASTLKEN